MSNWTAWVLCKVIAVDGIKVTMLPIAEENGTEFSFIVPDETPPQVGDMFRFTPMEIVT